MLSVKHVLELGTLGGYSAIWMASENPDLHITSIEFNPHHASVARQNIQAAGLSKQIEIILGAGLDVLPKIFSDIESGKREKFGFTFIDADKLNNWNYFDWAVKMSVPRACIVVDNIASKGRLADAQVAEEDQMVKGGREVVEKVGRDLRVDGVVLQTVSEKNYDGYAALFALYFRLRLLTLIQISSHCCQISFDGPKGS